MTNQNRKKITKATSKFQKNRSKASRKIENEKKGKKGKVTVELVSLITSVLALVVSIVAIFVSAHYSNIEYQYKLDPEVTAKSKFGIQVNQIGGERTTKAKSLGIEINILQKNNLQEAYFINSTYEVEKLEINEAEDALESKLNEEIQFGTPDLSIGEIDYQYAFLYLKGLDETSELYLIYVKSEDGKFVFDGISEIEVWGLANSHTNENEYKGEKIMAEQYLEILRGCEEYIL